MTLLGKPGPGLAGLGGKASNLALLARLGLTPDFLVIPAGEFAAAAGKSFAGGPGAAGRVRALRLPAAFRRRLAAAAARLGPGRLIVRSSCAGEDSAAASYAGLFFSGICSSRRDLPALVKEVWASQYGAAPAAYGGALSSRPAMAVIIQKYVEPDVAGVCFTGPGGTRYVEYCAGSHDAVESGRALPLFLYAAGGFVYQSVLSDPETPDWLRPLLERIGRLERASGCGPLDIEFAVSGGQVFLLQSRPLTAAAAPEKLYYAFPGESGALFHAGDFSEARAGALLRRAGFAPLAGLRKEGGRLTMRGLEFRRYNAAAAAAAGSPARVARFKEVFFDFLLAEARQAGRLGGLKAGEVIAGLKRLNCSFHLLECLHVTLQKCLEDRFISRHGEAWWKKNAAAFLPEVSFTAGRVAGALPRRKRRPVLPAGPEARALRELIDSRDRVDFYYKRVSEIYHRRLFDLTRYAGDIAALCPLPDREMEACLRGRPAPAPVSAALQSGPPPAFPLSGLTACGGSASGRAVLVRAAADLERVRAGDILVAMYTLPEYAPAIIRSAGVVTERGGLTSHAAIISREFRKPCLVGVQGCLAAIREGDRLRLSRGRVYRD